MKMNYYNVTKFITIPLTLVAMLQPAHAEYTNLDICHLAGELAKAMYLQHQKGITKSEYIKQTNFEDTVKEVTSLSPYKDMNIASQSILLGILNKAFTFPKNSDFYQRMEIASKFRNETAKQCEEKLSATEKIIAQKILDSRTNLKGSQTQHRGGYEITMKYPDSEFGRCDNGTTFTVTFGNGSYFATGKHTGIHINKDKAIRKSCGE